ncbi:carboxypeptidase regulatory-like domain-containing protein [candidate division WOR-3 bacterium]|nr:carboxypeptidase regulatory-like domain-containing protein [candidate division WOR-3 bacterium]
MNTRGRCYPLLATLAVAAVLRCTWDAPRDNPLDPTLGGNISGRVLTRRATPIAGASVNLPSAGRVVATDSTGNFELHGLPEETAWIYITADGYASDSARVVLAKGEIYTLAVYLDGLPYLQDCRLTTHVYGRNWPPKPLTFCTLTAAAGDVDGASDVDSVWVEIPSIGYSKRLVYNSDQRLFVQTIWATDLPGEALDTLVGQEVRFKVADLESAVATSSFAGVSRIIADLPEPTFPFGGVDTLSSDTLFLWYRFDRGFGVRYHGQVVRIEGGNPAGVVTEFDTPDTTQLVNSGHLDSGDYYWTIEVIDGFGNSSRSAEELFHAD